MSLPEYIVNLLNEIATKEGFTDYEYEVESGSNHGDNFIAVLTAIKLIGSRQQCDQVVTEKLHLLCKSVPQSAERRKTFRSIPAFKREVFMYTRVLLLFVDFQRDKGLSADESFSSFPKVFASIFDEDNDQFALIMEDLRARSFVMWPRHEPIRWDHEQMLLKQMARFHGISFALKDQWPEVFAEFEALDDVVTDFIENGYAGPVIDACLERAVKVLRNVEHKRVVDKFQHNYLETYKSFFDVKRYAKFGIIGHGDCWVNNFLYQYDDETNALKDMCFLDWQLSRYTSPALDLHFHFFSSTRKALRDDHYTELLNIYHDALTDIVRRLGSDPEKLFRLEDLMEELKACGKYAVIIGVSMVPFVLSEPNEIADMEEYSVRFAKGEKATLFTSDINPNSVYSEAVNEIVGDVIAYGFDH